MLLESDDQMEIEAAIFASDRISAISKIFAKNYINMLDTLAKGSFWIIQTNSTWLFIYADGFYR